MQFKIKIMDYAVVLRMLTMTTVWLLLLVWFLTAYRISCVVAAIMFALLTVVLLVAGLERTYFLRRALFNESLEREGVLFALVHNRFLVTARELVIAALLTLFLLISTVTFEPRQWSLLFAALLLLTLIIPRIAGAMHHEVREQYRFAIARHWAMWISVVLLWGEALLVMIFSPRQDFYGMRWQEVLSYGIAQPDIACPTLRAATMVFSTGEGLAVWAVQNWERVLNDPTQAVMLWVGLIALIVLPFLMALAASRALIGAMGRPWQMWESLSRNGLLEPNPATGSADEAAQRPRPR
jgi:hypothetical protein